MLESILTDLLGKIFFTSLVLITTYVISFFVKKGIYIIFSGIKGRVGAGRLNAKTRTLRSLLTNIVDVVLLIIAVLMILSHWGMDITPILTGAGILGLAFSFGAQSIVKDFISGFFIILEDIYSVGDVVKIGGDIGTVERITLRMTVLRDKEGNTVYIPNSMVNAVTRYTPHMEVGKDQPTKKRV